MSTRGGWGFVLDGEEKLTYNHSDSYPDGLGLELLAWLRGASGDLEALKARVRALKLVDEQRKAPAREVKRLTALAGAEGGYEGADTAVGSGQADDWYCLLRDCQGDPNATLAAERMIDSREFPLDSLFCEWAYVIDLDELTFEVYRGFQTEPHDRGRFAARLDAPQVSPGGTLQVLQDLPRFGEKPKPTGQVVEVPRREYYAVALVSTWPISALPGDEAFIAALGDDE